MPPSPESHDCPDQWECLIWFPLTLSWSLDSKVGFYIPTSGSLCSESLFGTAFPIYWLCLLCRMLYPSHASIHHSFRKENLLTPSVPCKPAPVEPDHQPSPATREGRLDNMDDRLREIAFGAQRSLEKTWEVCGKPTFTSGQLTGSSFSLSFCSQADVWKGIFGQVIWS